MKQNKANILFAVCSFSFLAHQCLQKIAKIEIPVLDNYLDPLLLMPVLLHLAVIERRILLNRPAYQLSLTHITGYFVLVAVVAEIIFPLLNARFVADILDIFFYALGGIVYSIIHLSRTTVNQASLGYE